MTRPSIAGAILEQLGGKRFCTMCGIKSRYAIENGLELKWSSRSGPNNCRITLEPDDTYKMWFYRTRGLGWTTTSTFYGVHADQLTTRWTGATGLRTSL